MELIIKFCKKCNKETERNSENRCIPCRTFYNHKRYISTKKKTLQEMKEKYSNSEIRQKILNYKKQFYRENIDKIKEKYRVFRLNNKEKLNLKSRLRAALPEYKEKQKIWNKNYYKLNKQKIFNQHKQYLSNPITRKRRAKNHVEYVKKRKKEDLQFKINLSLRSSLTNGLKARGFKKLNKFEILVGCTTKELKVHIENQFKEGMDWNNKGKWHIDHIKPCASFNLLSLEEQKKCFHYTNLQPLWGKDNLSKGSIYQGKKYSSNRQIKELI